MIVSQSTQNLAANDFDEPITFLTPRGIQTRVVENEQRANIQRDDKIRQITLNMADLLVERSNSFCLKKHAKSIW